MNGFDERYAVVLHPENRPLARWLRPMEAAAFTETYNRLVRDAPRHARMIREPTQAWPGEEETSAK